MKLNKIIAIVQAEKGLSAQQMAGEMDFSVTRLNDLKRAEQCNTKTLEKLARVYGKSVADLVSLQDR